MRWVLLLVGLVVGFALGRSDIGRAEFERSRTRQQDELTGVSPHPQEPRENAERKPAHSKNTVARDFAAPTQETLPVGFEDAVGMGVLISERPETVFVYSIGLGGTRWEEQVSLDGQALAPGTYDVWWLKNEIRIGRKARVEAGKVTRIRPGDGGTPFVPDGLSVVSARVARCNGEPATGLHISLRAVDQIVNAPIGADGVLSLLVRPGHLLASVGDLEQRVQLEPGQQRVLEFSHAQHGDLLFDPKPNKEIAALLRIRTVYLPRVTHEGSLWQSADAAGFLFVNPGEYEVLLKRGHGLVGGSIIGRAVVSAGRETRFEVIPPTGKLTININIKLAAGISRRGALVVSLHGGPTGESELEKTAAKKLSLTNYRVIFPALFPGRYRVKCREEILEVSVGKGEVSVEMRVEK